MLQLLSPTKWIFFIQILIICDNIFIIEMLGCETYQNLFE